MYNLGNNLHAKKLQIALIEEHELHSCTTMLIVTCNTFLCKAPKRNPAPYTSTVTLALGFVTLTPSSLARAIISTLFLDETACAILSYVSPCYWSEYVDRTNSAANVLLCMRRRSTSRVLLTRKALWPEGIMWRVFLLEPKPICTHHQYFVLHVGLEVAGGLKRSS